MTTGGWRFAFLAGVGGVAALALPDEDRVVVGSHSGLGVFDATTGDRLLRIHDETYAWWNDERSAIVVPGEGSPAHLSPGMGLWGGSLPTITDDGWGCARTSTGATLTNGDHQVTVEDDEQFVACGFSPRGSVFVLATSPNVTVFHRR